MCLDGPTPSVTTNASNPPGRYNPPFSSSAFIFLFIKKGIFFSGFFDVLHPNKIINIKMNFA